MPEQNTLYQLIVEYGGMAETGILVGSEVIMFWL
jgi:hypothetical protein